MYTLPVTCKQILIIVVGIITTISTLAVLAGMPYMFFGAIALGVEGVLGAVVGVIYLQEWLSDNVRCKCEK